MSSFITAAKCSQCGGNLDLNTLHCPYCSTSYKINWESVSTKAQPAQHRDQLIDAVVIVAIRKAAATEGIETDFCIFTDENISYLRVMVKDNQAGEWIEIADIAANQDGYSIEPAEGYVDPTHLISHTLNWSDRIKGGRFYTLSHFDESLDGWSEHHLRGEDKLLEYLSGIADRIIEIAVNPTTYEKTIQQTDPGQEENPWSI